MNVDKTKYLYIRADAKYLELDKNITIKKRKKYKYLGVTFGTDRRDNLEIQKTIAQRRRIIGSLNRVFWPTDIKKNRKKDI